MRLTSGWPDKVAVYEGDCSDAEFVAMVRDAAPLRLFCATPRQTSIGLLRPPPARCKPRPVTPNHYSPTHPPTLPPNYPRYSSAKGRSNGLSTSPQGPECALRSRRVPHERSLSRYLKPDWHCHIGAPHRTTSGGRGGATAIRHHTQNQHYSPRATAPTDPATNFFPGPIYLHPVQPPRHDPPTRVRPYRRL